MTAFRTSPGLVARPRVPRSASVLGGAAILVLLVPVIAALPDLPFGRWRPMWAPFLQLDAVSVLFTLPIILLLGAVAIAPVVLAAAIVPGRPLAFWLALASYLGAALAGYGATYRTLAGDGLEYIPLHVFIGLGAAIGTVFGALIDPWVRHDRARIAVAGIALIAAVVGALCWSVTDAAAFDAQRQARLDRFATPRAGTAGAGKAEVTVAARACLGTPSADGRIRLFTLSECTDELAGRWVDNGECLKPEGGSHSWDLRELNLRCPH